MSTSPLTAPRPLPHPVSRQALVITALVLAIVAAVTVLALTASTKVNPGSTRIVAPRALMAPLSTAHADAVLHAGGTPFGGFK
jgi:multisubunit Na+/H+ antiporter MnhC subunit